MAETTVLLRDFHRPKLRIACRRCPFAKEYSTRWLDNAFGRERPLHEILDAMTMGCGRHPLSEHRTGRRDETCEAYLPDLEEEKRPVAMSNDVGHGAPAGAGDPFDDETMAEALIADCDGDPRAAVLVLLRINHALMRERSELVSKGYIRSRVPIIGAARSLA